MKKLSLFVFCSLSVIVLFFLTSFEPLLIPLITFQPSQSQWPYKPFTVRCLGVNKNQLS